MRRLSAVLTTTLFAAALTACVPFAGTSPAPAPAEAASASVLGNQNGVMIEQAQPEGRTVTVRITKPRDLLGQLPTWSNSSEFHVHLYLYNASNLEDATPANKIADTTDGSGIAYNRVSGPITFRNLKYSGTYFVVARAFENLNSTNQISVDASSSVAIPAFSDDNVEQTISLPLTFVAREFAGDAETEGLTIADGGYADPIASETIDLNLL